MFCAYKASNGNKVYNFVSSIALWRKWNIGKTVCYSIVYYEGRSINKLQNGTIPLILKIGKIRNIRIVGNLTVEICWNFYDDDVIITTSLLLGTRSVCAVFCPAVFFYSSQVLNCVVSYEQREQVSK